MMKLYIKMPLKKALLLLFIGALVLVAGCTSNVANNATSSNTPGTNTPMAMTYANNYLTYLKSTLEPNNTIPSSNVVQNGSDAAQLTVTLKNTTPNGIWANGTATTMALNIKHYPSVDAATAFYNSQSFGYTTMTNDSLKGTGVPQGVVYAQTMGHNATLIHGATKIGSSSSFLQVTGSMIVQQDEFVVWGDISSMPV
jgi:hypothetical protein